MSNAIQIVDKIKASTGNDPILVESRMGYDPALGLVLTDLDDTNFITKAMGTSGGSIVISLPKIDAGTTIPFFIDISLYSGADATFDMITKATSYDPGTGLVTGRLQRYYDMPAEEQDTVGDGTGTFTGWNLYGHDDGSGNFKEDTYVILRG